MVPDWDGALDYDHDHDHDYKHQPNIRKDSRISS